MTIHTLLCIPLGSALIHVRERVYVRECRIRSHEDDELYTLNKALYLPCNLLNEAYVYILQIYTRSSKHLQYSGDGITT